MDKTSKSDLNDLLNSDFMKEYQEMVDEKKRSIKIGDNVVHLEYLSDLVTQNDIQEIESKLNTVKLELSHFDKSGVVYASLDEYSLVMYLAITQPLISNLINGVAGNATWDMIKWILLSNWQTIRGKVYTRNTSSTTTKKEVSFGLKVKLDKNTSLDFALKGDLEKEVIESSLDKVLGFLEKQQPNANFANADYVYFDDKKDEWIRIDVEKELRKKPKRKK